MVKPQLVEPQPVEELLTEPIMPGPMVMVAAETAELFTEEFTVVGVVVEFGAALVGISQLKRTLWA